MTLPRTITDAIKNGYSSDFTSMLEEFGKWSRYFGCQGYGGGSGVESYNIDDASAAIIDQVFAKMKQEHPGLHMLMSRYYIGRMSEMQIARELKKQKLINDRCIKYANTLMVRERLKAGDLYVLEALQQYESN